MSTASSPQGPRPVVSLRGRRVATGHPKGDHKTSTTAWAEHDGVVYTAYDSPDEWPEWTDAILLACGKGA
jgi:hypothetical protein